MRKNIGLGAFGTFGSPGGFQQTFYYDARFTQTLDLNPSAIEVHPESEIFAVRKEINNGVHTVCFCLYTYAREPQSGRRGSFIGSCLVLENCIAEGNYIYECLREFHHDLIVNEKNLIDNVLQVNKATSLEVKEPHKYKELVRKSSKFSTKYSTIDTQEYYLISGENLKETNLANNISYFFTHAIKTFPKVGTLYFTTNSQVIEYVKSKHLIPVVSIEEFVEKTNSHPESTDKSEKIKNSQSNITRTNYQEPDLEEFYKPWKEPKNPWTMSETRSRVEEHNNLLTNYKNAKTQISNLKTYGRSNSKADKSIFSEIFAFLWFYKIPAMLLVALLSTWVILIYLYLNITDPRPNTNNTTSINTPKSTTTDAPPKKLDPQPNGDLNENDLKIINEQQILGISASEITNLVMFKNPTDVGNHYKNQKNLYAKELIRLNEGCFDGQDEFARSKCENLKRIPIYKPTNP